MISGKRYEVLNGLPPYGPMYVPISADDEPFYSEGYVVKFQKSNGDEWVANFRTGWTNYYNVFEFAEYNIVVVFAGGQGYIINLDEEKLKTSFDISIENVIQKDDGSLICANNTHIMILDNNKGEFWRSERISWDGIKDLKILDNKLHGKSYDPTNDIRPWSKFIMDLESNEISGGSFQEYLDRNEHLEVQENGMLREKTQTDKKPWWKIW